MDRLRALLRRIDGRGYRDYKELTGGRYLGRALELRVDHVQGDPFAEPSRVALVRPVATVGIPGDLLATRGRRVAVEDFLTRRVAAALEGARWGRRGSGKSGVLRIDRPGQEVLERTSCLIRGAPAGSGLAGSRDGDGGTVEVRLQVGLPAQGRRILGREADALLIEDLPRLADDALSGARLPLDELVAHVHRVEDQQAARAALAARGLVAFVAEGAVLPRMSGVDPRPMPARPMPARPMPARPMPDGAVPFGPVPERLRVELELPHAGRVVGLGVPEGVTVIVGGGFHGKSTLLDALALGIYDHVPGDGRDLVVTRTRAVTIRAEDGRRIEAVDISPFIGDLPLGRDTTRFGTDDASGSTSQAAAIQEAVELGAEALLLDEDTSANNFLVRDFRMQELVHKDREPITPFIDRVRELRDVSGVSTVLVLGGSSDYLDVADTVLQMDAYRPVDVTERAREICARYPNPRRREGRGAFAAPAARVPAPESFDPSRGTRAERVRARETRTIQFGETEIEIDALDQLVDGSQARTIGDALLAFARGAADGRRTLGAILDALAERIDRDGLDALAARTYGDRAAVRPLDIGAAVNRMRTLRVRDERS